jgi:Family of unknown function (DUF5995)
MTVLVWGPVQRDVSALLADPPDDVPAVVRHLTGLQCLLARMPSAPARNPIADFNRLYLRITTGLLERLYAGSFADPAFVSRLDVEFAARYFDAVRAWSEARPCCPQVWSVLFGRTAGPVPSAAAGINAHINFDLPFALVTTFDQLGSDPIDDSDQHRDYLQINDMFAGAIPGLRRGYLDRWQLLIDTMNGDLDDWWQGEAETYARNVAWRHAQKLWAMRHDLSATADERARLDGHAAALSRLLFSPLSAIFQ